MNHSANSRPRACFLSNPLLLAGPVDGEAYTCGFPRRRPEKLHANKAYDIARCRMPLTKRRTKVCIDRKGIDSSGRLGRRR